MAKAILTIGQLRDLHTRLIEKIKNGNPDECIELYTNNKNAVTEFSADDDDVDELPGWNDPDKKSKEILKEINAALIPILAKYKPSDLYFLTTAIDYGNLNCNKETGITIDGLNDPLPTKGKSKKKPVRDDEDEDDDDN